MKKITPILILIIVGLLFTLFYELEITYKEELKQISFDNYNAIIEDGFINDEIWIYDEEEIARKLIHLDKGDGDRTVTIKHKQEHTIVILIDDNLRDDSVKAIKYVFTVERNDKDYWIITDLHWGMKCWDGRGQQVFRTELCH